MSSDFCSNAEMTGIPLNAANSTTVGDSNGGGADAEDDANGDEMYGADILKGKDKGNSIKGQVASCSEEKMGVTCSGISKAEREQSLPTPLLPEPLEIALV